MPYNTGINCVYVRLIYRTSDLFNLDLGNGGLRASDSNWNSIDQTDISYTSKINSAYPREIFWTHVRADLLRRILQSKSLDIRPTLLRQ